MNTGPNTLAALAALAHRALSASHTEYARHKAIISQFFRSSCAVENKKEVRLTLIDSFYSSKVASLRTFGISDIVEKLRVTFPGGDEEVKTQAALWIASGFENTNPLYDLFAAQYGLIGESRESRTAPALLSMYLYFVTGYAFPIYESLGSNYYYLAGKQTAPKDAQKRFQVLQEIMRENGINGFDQADNLFWLYGKIDTGDFPLLLNKTRYVRLVQFAEEKSIKDVVKEIRDSKNADTLQDILGPDLYEFIQQMPLDKVTAQ
jgi:hypothetical protein